MLIYLYNINFNYNCFNFFDNQWRARGPPTKMRENYTN